MRMQLQSRHAHALHALIGLLNCVYTWEAAVVHHDGAEILNSNPADIFAKSELDEAMVHACAQFLIAAYMRALMIELKDFHACVVCTRGVLLVTNDF